MMMRRRRRRRRRTRQAREVGEGGWAVAWKVAVLLLLQLPIIIGGQRSLAPALNLPAGPTSARRLAWQHRRHRRRPVGHRTRTHTATGDDIALEVEMACGSFSRPAVAAAAAAAAAAAVQPKVRVRSQ
jgi:hypothetical protein